MPYKNYDIRQAVGVEGQIRFGKLKGKNTITNNGLRMIMQCLFCGNALPPFYVALGDDDSISTPADIKTQNVLQNELQRLIFVQNTLGPTLEADTNKIQVKITSDFANSTESPLNDKTIKEIGLFDTYKNGTMYARKATEDQITIDVGSIYDGEWNLIFSKAQAILDSGGIVDAGLSVLGNSIRRIDELAQLPLTYPWFINQIQLGTSATSTSNGLTEVIEPIQQSIRPPTIINMDLTNPEEPKIIIQYVIRSGEFTQDIKEAGLFNSHFRSEYGAAPHQKTVETTMFSRVVLDPILPAGQEAVLNWEITLKRV